VLLHPCCGDFSQRWHVDGISGMLIAKIGIKKCMLRWSS
jgi:hypothetical protein